MAGKSKDFQRATKRVLPPPVEPIASKPELERLEAGRSKPKAELHHTPGGVTEKAVHKDMDKERERRIERIRGQLRGRKDRARDSFDRSR